MAMSEILRYDFFVPELTVAENQCASGVDISPKLPQRSPDS